MQNTGAILLAAQRCSLVRMWTPAQDSRSAHGLLYLAAVQDRSRLCQAIRLVFLPVRLKFMFGHACVVLPRGIGWALLNTPQRPPAGVRDEGHRSGLANRIGR